MNGAQEPRRPYQDVPVPPPPAPREIDPGLGEVPPTWRKNIYGYGDDPRRKSPALAAMLSAMPGLGQIYVGYYQQGFTNVVVVAALIGMLNARGMSPVHPMLGFFLAFFWLYNVVDAFRRATFYNHSLAGLGGEAPADMKVPTGGGSLVGGIALVALGLLLFANTGLGMSLDWLEQWWPMALVLLGLYLVYSSYRSRRTAATASQPSATAQE